MGKELSTREVQLEQLEILKKTVAYIEKKGLFYFLTGGTLIGAIRHKGFIPWDDDIDIIMPREDYDKFIECVKEDPFDDDHEVQALALNNYNMPYCKVINKRIPIKSKSKEDKFLWIDIFPFDGLPDSEKEFIKIRNKNKRYMGQIYLKSTSFKDIWKEKRSLQNRILKVILKPVASRHSFIYYAKKMDKIARKYNYNDCYYVGDIAWPGCIEKRMKREWFLDVMEAEFENTMFKIPVGYHEYLTNSYGDYMKIPPEEDRITHGTIAYKMD